VVMIAVVCVAWAGCATGKDRLQAYPAEAHALGLAASMSTNDLLVFGSDECLAAGAARSDQGAALLKFKGDHVSAAYNRNDQVAIELFRVLFVATGHLVCPQYDGVIQRASRPLL
jgi:hypothetical protein